MLLQIAPSDHPDKQEKHSTGLKQEDKSNAPTWEEIDHLVPFV